MAKNQDSVKADRAQVRDFRQMDEPSRGNPGGLPPGNEERLFNNGDLGGLIGPGDRGFCWG